MKILNARGASTVDANPGYSCTSDNGQVGSGHSGPKIPSRVTPALTIFVISVIRADSSLTDPVEIEVFGISRLYACLYEGF